MSIIQFKIDEDFVVSKSEISLTPLPPLPPSIVILKFEKLYVVGQLLGVAVPEVFFYLFKIYFIDYAIIVITPTSLFPSAL